jgi:hypothetical protein
MALPKTLQDLWKKDPRIMCIDDERDLNQGYWIYLKDEFWCTRSECSTIHEDRVKDCLEFMRSVEPKPNCYNGYGPAPEGCDNCNCGKMSKWRE